MAYDKKFSSLRLSSLYCWRGFGLLRFSEKLPDSLHHKGLHEFLDSNGDPRRDYSVSWHHNRINWVDQENVNFGKNTFPSTNNVLKRLSSLATGLLYDFNCGETCWAV